MTRLYLISPPKFDLNDFKSQLQLAFKGGAVPVFQLRMKSAASDGTFTAPADPKEVKKVVKELMPICRDNNCSFILNDDVRLATELDCDGVHIGEDDMPVKEARKIIGAKKYVGTSCYGSVDRAFTASEDGADYVAFGAFYDTKTKTPKGCPKPDILEFWAKYTIIPSVAIGGIKVENVEPLVKAGADFIAVVTGVWNYAKGIDIAVKDFNDLFKKFHDGSK